MTAYFYTYNMIFDIPVSGNSKLVYAYLCKCADMNGKSYPSHASISANAGIGVTTVKKALAELENAGLISIQGQARPDKGRRANIYTVIKENVNGFFLIYEKVFTSALTAKARLVYLYFCRLASGREQAYPSHKTTAKACGLSVAGVRLAIDELEAAGLIERQAQYRDNGGQRANIYTIITEQNGTINDGGSIKPREQQDESPETQEDSQESDRQPDTTAAHREPDEKETADETGISSTDTSTGSGDMGELNAPNSHLDTAGTIIQDNPKDTGEKISMNNFVGTYEATIPEDFAPNPAKIRDEIRCIGFFMLRALMRFAVFYPMLCSFINPLYALLSVRRSFIVCSISTLEYGRASPIFIKFLFASRYSLLKHLRLFLLGTCLL